MNGPDALLERCTTYLSMGAPLLLDGAVQTSLVRALPGVATGDRGADGTDTAIGAAASCAPATGPPGGVGVVVLAIVVVGIVVVDSGVVVVAVAVVGPAAVVGGVVVGGSVNVVVGTVEVVVGSVVVVMEVVGGSVVVGPVVGGGLGGADPSRAWPGTPAMQVAAAATAIRPIIRGIVR